WADLYKSIRFCNLYFSKVDEIPFGDNLTDGKTLKDRMTGEMHFLRAYNYFNLISTYGGVPIITDSYVLSGEVKKERNSFEERVDLVVDEMDQAAELLLLVRNGKDEGRAKMGAAMALKSRVLLYAASDLYNTDIFPSYERPVLIRYMDNN